MNLYTGDPPVTRWTKSKSSGMGSIVFPGGAHNVLDMVTAATALAARLGTLGISVFGL